MKRNCNVPQKAYLGVSSKHELLPDVWIITRVVVRLESISEYGRTDGPSRKAARRVHGHMKSKSVPASLAKFAGFSKEKTVLFSYRSVD